jgi:2-oxoglutarate ferredoxin oxidoreductase subunit alpha
MVPAPEIHASPGGGTQIGIVSLGGCHAAVMEARDLLHSAGVEADYMRIRAFPFGATVRPFLDAHPIIFVVEQNRDAQLRSLLAIETGKPRDEMIPVLDYGGLPLTAYCVVSSVTAQLSTLKTPAIGGLQEARA